MGLEGVELVMELEDQLGIKIPNDAAASMRRPQDSLLFALTQLPLVRAEACITRQTFYRVRRGLAATRPHVGRVRLSTRLVDFADGETRSSIYARVRTIAGIPGWPSTVPWRSWWRDGPETVRELVLWIAMRLPLPNTARGEPWTREQVELGVRRAMYEVKGLKDFALDADYVRELGLST